MTTRAASKQTKSIAVPVQTNEHRQIFEIEEYQLSNPKKLANYEWNLILNHASPEILTTLARNSKLRIPSLDTLSTTKEDTTCRACFECKMERAPHSKTLHKYTKGEAAITDIKGLFNIPGRPSTFKKYCITFINAAFEVRICQTIAVTI